jgi:hypothetical protein
MEFFEPLSKQSPLFRDPYLRGAVIAALIPLLLAGGIAIRSFGGEQHLLVIHFTGGHSLDFFGTVTDIFEIIVTAFVVMGLNVALVLAFYSRVRPFAYLLSFFNIFFAILILIAVAVIISVN